MPGVNHAMSSGQARSIKRRGDFLRMQFRNQCCAADNLIKAELLRGLTNPIAPGNFTMKTGMNWQFHLGQLGRYNEKWKTRISEDGKTIFYGSSEESITYDLYSSEFLKSFILKGNYLVTAHSNDWLIFSSDDILSVLQDSEITRWRILDSGRIKGDLHSTWGKRTVFTIEYRAEKHKQTFVIGAHGGGAGARLGTFLRESLIFNSIPIDYESWNR